MKTREIESLKLKSTAALDSLWAPRNGMPGPKPPTDVLHTSGNTVAVR